MIVKKSIPSAMHFGIFAILVALGMWTGFSQTVKSIGTDGQQLFGTEFSVAGMVCEDCAKSAQEAMSQISGVTKVTVDVESEIANIRSTREVARTEIEEALGALGFEVRFPGDVIIEPLSKQEKANLDIEVISGGEIIHLNEHLAPGKVTMFDYYAEWCGPCHLLSPKLERLLLKYPDLALRKVDIVDWKSEAAKQATREFALQGLPYVSIYAQDGSPLGQVQGNQIDKVEEIIKKSFKP